MKSRIVILFIGFCALWVLLLMRAASLQVLPNEKLKALRERQFRTVITLQSRRGAVTDRNGRELALSTKAFSLYADPKLIEGRKWLSRKLAKELGVSVESISSKLKDSSRRFVWIQRFMEPALADRIRAWDIRGLSFVEEWRRVYPNESILSHTLGFMGNEGQGLEGLELQYDNQLKGNQKKIAVRRDARGRPLVADGLLFAENPDGNDLKLTIDSEIQYMLETELVSAVKEFEADSAVGIVLDAQTSAVRAMVSVPTFDANRAMKVNPEVRRNRAVTDAYEPGSTMKAFMAAIALREGKIRPNSKFFCENGSFKVDDRVIREADSHHSFGWLSVSEILAVSSNIGTSKIAFLTGDEVLRKGLMDFGFGSKLGVDLPGEGKGTLLPLPWRSHLLANISFGQGITATPLQIANGYAVIANGGILNTPYIVESERDSETGLTSERLMKPQRRVLSEEQASQLRLMLSGVTSPSGTGVNAKVNGFIVGGKTGTAQKVNPKGRGYLQGAYISSFAGFIPAHQPRFVIYVAVDQPRKSYYGSQVAAPIFSRVASYAVRREGLAPLLLSDKNLVNGRKMIGRMPTAAAPESVSVAGEILNMPESKIPTVMPDFSKQTMRDVLRKFGGQDLKLRFVGRGVVSETLPAAGEPLAEGKDITVFLR